MSGRGDVPQGMEAGEIARYLREHPEFFEQYHVLVTPVYAGKYPPGHSLLIAPGNWVGMPGLVPVLLAGIAGALLFLLARRYANPWVALLTWAIWTTAPGNLRFLPAYMSQNTTIVLWLAGWWALAEWLEGRGAAWLAALSACGEKKRASGIDFAAYGDARHEPQVHRRIINSIATSGAKYVVVTGDLVDYADDEAEWLEVRGILKDLRSRAGYYCAVGDHDAGANLSDRGGGSSQVRLLGQHPDLGVIEQGAVHLAERRDQRVPLGVDPQVHRVERRETGPVALRPHTALQLGLDVAQEEHLRLPRAF